MLNEEEMSKFNEDSKIEFKYCYLDVQSALNHKFEGNSSVEVCSKAVERLRYCCEKYLATLAGKF